MAISKLQQMVYASLMAALTAVGAYIIIPIPLSPVPVVLQNLFVLLAGLLLGSRWAVVSMGIYLMVGAIGMPVFAGGKGGIMHFASPTGGYLLGFALCACLVGWIAERYDNRIAGDIAAVILGSLIVYACGVPWLKAAAGITWGKAFIAGMLPFLPGDIIKGAAAVMVARSIRPVVKRQLEAVSA